ncbi:carbohydrate binding domain-containing protein [Pseudobacteriovorax antillogorgiicola]|uniref:Carbohydrate binding domain-containing protein n=1 Tax=Pseudobacteriovorax antillogorgiicola TaxID=1513793 RepID=A0A1Y6CCJ7_9BACT|nr:carbohydrate binding domain-containing protein [Pseudobacteriovorax antillogorgiicola]TCS49351.1 carbohydrate binding protein [Pseudobacteriovorax antillogorgiicola]SMF47622.1 Carbohydrate binding domain-containing protein [Pseudobacteriovorax antillogorgiicola]
MIRFFGQLVSTVALISGSSLFAGNLVSNGDFSQGSNHWQTYVFESEASATFSIGAFYDDGRVTISDGGSEAWHIQLTQSGISLEKGKSYRLRFDYTTSSHSSDGDIDVAIEEAGNDYTQYFPAVNLQANPGPGRFDRTFTMSHESDDDARIAFNFGNNETPLNRSAVIWVDNVTLEEVNQDHKAVKSITYKHYFDYAGDPKPECESANIGQTVVERQGHYSTTFKMYVCLSYYDPSLSQPIYGWVVVADSTSLRP